MAGKVFTLNEAIAHMKKQMEETFADEVAEKIRDVQQEKIDEEVYDAYSGEYQRRKDNDGLRDRRNMVITKRGIAGDSAIVEIRNITDGVNDDFQIADLVEYGDGFNGKEYKFKGDGSGAFLEARPFTRETVEELENTGQHIGAFVQGMRKRGINVTKK